MEAHMANTLERVSSTEFQTRAGLYLDRAAAGAVVITKFRRPSRVLMDFDEYNRLRDLAAARPTRQAMRAEEMGPDLAEAVAGASYSYIDPELDKLMR